MNCNARWPSLIVNSLFPHSTSHRNARMFWCLDLVKFLKIRIGISPGLFELAQWNFAWLIPRSRGSFILFLMGLKKCQAVQPDQPAYQMKKWKNGITSKIIVRFGRNFAWSFLWRFLITGIKTSLVRKIFLRQPTQPEMVLVEIFLKKHKKSLKTSET